MNKYNFLDMCTNDTSVPATEHDIEQLQEVQNRTTKKKLPKLKTLKN